MGRQAGTKGDFVAPQSRDYAAPLSVPADKPAPPSVAVPKDGNEFLPLTTAAYAVYAAQLPAALQTIEHLFGQFGTVQGRAKNPASAANRIQRAVQNGWAKKIETVEDVLDNLWDAVGTRVVLRDSSPQTMNKLTHNLIQAVKDGKLSIEKIENLHSSPIGLPYLTSDNVSAIDENIDIEVKSKPYNSGYTAVMIFVKDQQGVRGEIQLIGQEVMQLANAEHLVYDAFLNKPYLPAFEPTYHAQVESQIMPIRAAAQALDISHQQSYQQYMSGEYDNARRIESGQPRQPNTLPTDTSSALTVENLLQVNEYTSPFKLKN